MGRGWKSFGVHAGRSLSCHELTTRAILVRAQEEKRRAAGKDVPGDGRMAQGHFGGHRASLPSQA